MNKDKQIEIMKNALIYIKDHLKQCGELSYGESPEKDVMVDIYISSDSTLKEAFPKKIMTLEKAIENERSFEWGGAVYHTDKDGIGVYVLRDDNSRAYQSITGLFYNMKAEVEIIYE